MDTDDVDRGGTDYPQNWIRIVCQIVLQIVKVKDSVAATHYYLWENDGLLQR